MSKKSVEKINDRYSYGLLILIAVLSLPFAFYAIKLGDAGLTIGLSETETPHIPLNQSAHPLSNFGLSLHLLLGAILTLLAPLQVILGWSRKAMRWHKWLGYIIIFSAIFTGLGGLTYIMVNGTIGGHIMNIAFSIYGLLVLLSAVMAAKYARNQQIQLHEAWSMRLLLLGIGSWVYRMGYGMLFRLYDGPIGPNGDFQNGIDYFMDFAFYLIPLIGLELYFRYAKSRFHPLLISFILLLITCFFIYGFYGFFGT